VSHSRCILFLVFLLIGMTSSLGHAATPPRMRPYIGIGLVVFSPSGNTSVQDLQVPLYEEPGLSRIGILKNSRLSGNEWIFDLADSPQPLIVSARKGDWLRVFYDDSGREAWLDPQAKGRFQTWEQFLKLQTVHLLPGLQAHLYQLQLQPDGKQLATLTPKQLFRVLKLENAWGMVLGEQGQLGWIRWCDDDGRLLVGIGK
jgi:hypothetical protein